MFYFYQLIMNLLHRGAIFVTVLLLSYYTLTSSQTLPTVTPQTISSEKQTYISVRSIPSDATVELKGNYLIKGQTPFTVTELTPGEYQLKISKPGYESEIQSLIIFDGDQIELTIQLIRKSRLKTGFRSLFIPGWGQFYSGHTTKGWVFSITQACAITAFILSNSEYDDKVEEYNTLKDLYINATYIEDIERYRKESKEKYNEAENWYQYREIAIYSVLGIWAYNILDSVVLFPIVEERSGSFTNKNDAGTINISTRARFNKLEIKLCKKF